MKIEKITENKIRITLKREEFKDKKIFCSISTNNGFIPAKSGLGRAGEPARYSLTQTHYIGYNFQDGTRYIVTAA